VRKILSTLALSLFVCSAGLASELTTHPDAVTNGGFEAGELDPTAWRRDAYLPASAAFAWDGTQAHEGSRSVKISALAANDARWLQTVAVEPDTTYLLSGWIRTAGVTDTLEVVNAGANLCLYGTWDRSPGVFGTKDWTYVSLVFHSGSRTQVEVGARLGFSAGTATGTAWFDDVRVTPILPTDPHPRWKILALIYGATDFRFTDATGDQRHVTATMTSTEKQLAASAARRFVLQDIPLLTSGNMVPTVEVRFPARPLTELSPFGSGWWPAPSDTVPERDFAFDSVLVIWDPNGVDESTGAPVFLGTDAGLTPAMGTGPTYATLIVDAATSYGHLNVFKHEWGHSILEFYEALGTAPKPKVENHATVTDYVNCLTGEPYLWMEETDSHPIPGSIYSNESGFTHDYYSGTTALSRQPDRCLGITPGAWAAGGPVSRPPRPEPLTPLQQIGLIRASIDSLATAGALERGADQPLKAKLDTATRALERGQEKTATQLLRAFVLQVRALANGGRLDAASALALEEAARNVIDRLQST
jgi:hypothetical protein